MTPTLTMLAAYGIMGLIAAPVLWATWKGWLD